MSTTITRTPQARRDLLELADHIAQDSLDTAERFLDATREAFDLLGGMPEMGTQCHFQSPGTTGIRMWSIRGFENYLIFYRPLAGGIDVVRVIHGARDIQSIFARDPDD